MLKIMDGREENCGKCGYDEYCPGVVRDFLRGIINYSHPEKLSISKEFYKEWYINPYEIVKLIESFTKQLGYSIVFEPQYNDFFGIEDVEENSITPIEDYRVFMENLSMKKFIEIFQ